MPVTIANLCLTSYHRNLYKFLHYNIRSITLSLTHYIWHKWIDGHNSVQIVKLEIRSQMKLFHLIRKIINNNLFWAVNHNSLLSKNLLMFKRSTMFTKLSLPCMVNLFPQWEHRKRFWNWHPNLICLVRLDFLNFPM